MILKSSNHTIENFKKHNLKLFNKKFNSSSKILIEFNPFATSHIPLSYFSNILSQKYKANILGIFNDYLITKNFDNKKIDRIKWNLGKSLGARYFGIYKSFNVKDFVLPAIDQKNNKSIELNIKNLKKNLTKEKLLKLKIEKILVGDIIYDTYLKRYKKATIIFDEEFYDYLKQFIHLFYYWKNYIKKNNVKSIVGHHAVYSYSIPLRICIHEKIPTFAINCMEVFKLSSSLFLKNMDHLNYKKNFSKIPKLIKSKMIKASMLKIKNRLSGNISAKEGMDYMSKTSFYKNYHKKNRLLKNTANIKILVSTHDFFDSVHAFGDLIFPDFYEWMIHIGKLSNITEHDWYVKTHPSYKGKFGINQIFSKKIVNEIITKFPRLKILPNNVSHLRLIKEGIDYVITCFGNVGIEYPNFDIPVICCCKKNPFVNYNFNIHPKSKKEFDKIIFNLKKNKKTINKKEIYEYYSMKVINQDRNFFIEDHDEMIKFVGGYDGQFTEKLYEYWLKNFNMQKHSNLIYKIKKFINSNKYTSTVYQ